MFKSIGTLIYSELPQIKLALEIDPQIAKYYRSLIPKYISLSVPMHAPHISVIRKAIPPNMNLWGKYQGEQIEFTYDPEICFGTVYCLIKCYSTRLEDIREELGLSRHSSVTRPPDEQPCFHTTLGNFKHLKNI